MYQLHSTESGNSNYGEGNMIRKFLWAVAAILMMGFSVPGAHADSASAVFTCSGSCLIVPSATVTGGAGPIFGLNLEFTDILSDTPIAPLVLESFPSGITTPTLFDWTFTDTSTTATFAITAPGSMQPVITIAFSGLSLEPQVSSLSETGTLLFTPPSTSSMVTPEPSSVALMLLGVGLVFVVRKRNSRGRQLAT